MNGGKQCDHKRNKLFSLILAKWLASLKGEGKAHDFQKALAFHLTKGSKEKKGSVQCWGDEKGNFVTGVNRYAYVYEIYVKARSAFVTKGNASMGFNWIF